MFDHNQRNGISGKNLSTRFCSTSTSGFPDTESRTPQTTGGLLWPNKWQCNSSAFMMAAFPWWPCNYCIIFQRETPFLLHVNPFKTSAFTHLRLSAFCFPRQKTVHQVIMWRLWLLSLCNYFDTTCQSTVNPSFGQIVCNPSQPIADMIAAAQTS